MCYLIDDYPSVHVCVFPKARVEHICIECRRTIKPGEVYRKDSGIFDGDPFTEKTCRDCCLLRQRIREIELSRGCAPDESEPPWGELLQAAVEEGIMKLEDTWYHKERMKRAEVS